MWRGPTTTADQPMGPHRPRSSVLTEAVEAIVVEFRRRTLLCGRAMSPRSARQAAVNRPAQSHLRHGCGTTDPRRCETEGTCCA